ncbi:MAG: hypothetical protein WDO24_04405 [Pseudomonadota bacterium]
MRGRIGGHGHAIGTLGDDRAVADDDGAERAAARLSISFDSAIARRMKASGPIILTPVMVQGPDPASTPRRKASNLYTARADCPGALRADR